MKVLALEPYFDGSHEAFLTGWQKHSSADWTLLTAAGHNWKWRMRHAPVTFAEQCNELISAGKRWDVVFCSDMLNLAEFRGLVGPEVGQLPAVIYFHENQLTYPLRHDDPRDVHFGLTNMTSALSADAVWFNSAFHRDSMLSALAELLQKFPQPRLLSVVEKIFAKSEIQSPGIDVFKPRPPRQAGPMRLLWAGRWEFDKNPETFFKAIELLEAHGLEYRLNVVGQQFRDVPEIFSTARQRFAHRIDQWGFLPSRADYVATLMSADVAVSTADHEFFGLSMVEAAAAGALPVAPNRLAYPEIFAAAKETSGNSPFIYDGTATALADLLAMLAGRLGDGEMWDPSWPSSRAMVERFFWPRRAGQLDESLANLAELK